MSSKQKALGFITVLRYIAHIRYGGDRWREEVMREGTKKGRVGQWRAEGTVELRMKIEEGRERKDGKRVRN